jgi:DNA-binding response OmpR family regulator
MADDSTSLAPGADAEPGPGILVIDDEQMLLDLLRLILQRKGFRVWTALDGPAALELYRQQKDAISVVLLDVCMTPMDGPQTLAELRRIDSTVLVCFMSGFTGNYSPEELVSLGAAFFFEKPFQIRPLAEQLWQLALEEKRRSA